MRKSCSWIWGSDSSSAGILRVRGRSKNILIRTRSICDLFRYSEFIHDRSTTGSRIHWSAASPPRAYSRPRQSNDTRHAPHFMPLHMICIAIAELPDNCLTNLFPNRASGDIFAVAYPEKPQQAEAAIAFTSTNNFILSSCITKVFLLAKSYPPCLKVDCGRILWSLPTWRGLIPVSNNG